MLKKKANKKAKTIVSVDNYTQSSYALKGTTLSPHQKLTLKSNFFFVTYLANKDMIIAPIEIGSGIGEEDLEGALENRAYEELGLDPTVEYMIRHLEIPHSGDGRLFQLFVIEQEKYTEIFSTLRKQVKYVDLIVPAPLLYRTLYELELVDRKGVHCYLYFTRYDTFLTFYKDGEYLYSKSIKYSFEQIYDRYCEMTGETVDEEMFFRILQKEGMKATQADYQQNIMKLFGEIFISINDIIIYTKRAYELEVIDQMFIGSSLGPIIGLDDYVQNYLGLYSSALEFDFQLETEEWHIDQLQLMMAISGLEYISQEDIVNLTQYPRPPAFFKRPAGQFVGATLAVTALALMPPAYYYVMSKANDTRNSILQNEETKLSAEASKYKGILTRKRKEITQLDKQITGLRTIFQGKEKTLTSVYDKKVHYQLKSEQMELFAGDLARYGVKTYNIETQYNEKTKSDEYYLSLVSESDKNITKLIKDISEKYEEHISSIDIKLIQKDQNSTFYQGVLKVGLQ